jgi:lipoate---protein ligase
LVGYASLTHPAWLNPHLRPGLSGRGPAKRFKDGPALLPPIETAAFDPPARPFRFLDFQYDDIASNLALDEALLIEAEERSEGPILRVWESPNLAVVLGASGRLFEDVDVERCRADGVAIARRSSGGGTVLIGPGALNVSVVLNVDAAPGLHAVDKAQEYVLERVARAIRERGPDARLQGSSDLTLGDRKFSGSAQRRLKRHFLVHASVLYDFPLPAIARYTRNPVRQPSYRANRSHEMFVTNVGMSRAKLVEAARAAFGLLKTPGIPHDVPANLVAALVAEKFSDRAWIARL